MASSTAGTDSSFRALVISEACATQFGTLKYCERQCERIAAAFAACPAATAEHRANLRKEDVLAAVAREAQACRTDQLLILYLAGHGLVLPDGQWRFVSCDTDPGDPDRSGLSLDEIARVVLGSAALGMVLLLDSCFAGKAIADVMALSGLRQRLILAVSASAESEEAWACREYDGTAFGQALLESLQVGLGAAESDQIVTAAALISFLGTRTEALARLVRTHQQVVTLLIRSPATTLLWITPGAPSNLEHRRIEYTLNDLARATRRTLVIATLILTGAVAIMGAWARLHQYVRVAGDVATVRAGFPGLGWFDGPVIREYAGFSGAPDHASWFLREPMATALFRTAPAKDRMGWVAGAGPIPKGEFERFLRYSHVDSQPQPGGQLLLTQESRETLDRMLRAEPRSWSPATLTALGLRNPSVLPSYLQWAVVHDRDWMAPLEALAPPCSNSTTVFLRERIRAVPTLAPVTNFGAFLGHCEWTVSDILDTQNSFPERAGLWAHLFYVAGRLPRPEVVELANTLAIKITQNIDASDELLGLQYLHLGCADQVRGVLERARRDGLAQIAAVPLVLACDHTTVDVRDGHLILHAPSFGVPALNVQPDSGTAISAILWVHAATAILAHPTRGSPQTIAWATDYLKHVAWREDTLSAFAAWALLRHKIPYGRAPTPLEPGAVDEIGWWRGCLADAQALAADATTRQLDFRPLAEGAAACHSVSAVTWIAQEDPWARGFLQAALQTQPEALRALDDRNPVVRTGAAQGLIMRADLDQLLPLLDRLRSDRLPNPEAAIVRPLADWRRHLSQVMKGLTPEARVTTAVMLVGTDGWTSYCDVVLGNPGLQGWLLDLALQPGSVTDSR